MAISTKANQQDGSKLLEAAQENTLWRLKRPR
jgi:hypothetical protein